MRKADIRVQSTIAKSIDTADQEAQYDACVKRLLSEKIILAWILRECVSEFRGHPVERIMRECIEGEPEISAVAVDQDELDHAEDPDSRGSMVEGRNTEDVSVKEGRIYYDIRFLAVVPGTKKPVHLILNIEAQKSEKTSYPIIKRAVYYAGRMISAQKNRVFAGSHYEKIRKVYSIWIQMNVSPEKANTITEYSIAEKNIVGSVREEKTNYDLLTIIMLGLGKAEKAEGQPILRLLDVLLSADTKPEDKKKILERDFDIPMSESMSEEANVMCNLGEGIREQAYEQAYEQATQVMRVETAVNLIRSLGLSAETALNAMGVPGEDRRPLLDLINEKLTE